jgi:hypothetical protein
MLIFILTSIKYAFCALYSKFVMLTYHIETPRKREVLFKTLLRVIFVAFNTLRFVETGSFESLFKFSLWPVSTVIFEKTKTRICQALRLYFLNFSLRLNSVDEPHHCSGTGAVTGPAPKDLAPTLVSTRRDFKI